MRRTFKLGNELTNREVEVEVPDVIVGAQDWRIVIQRVMDTAYLAGVEDGAKLSPDAKAIYAMGDSATRVLGDAQY